MTGASAKTVPAPDSVLVSGEGLQVGIYKKKKVNKSLTTILTATNPKNDQRTEKKTKEKEKSDTQYWVCTGICRHAKPVTSEALWDAGYDNLVWRCTFN